MPPVGDYGLAIIACIPVDTSTLPELPPGSPPLPRPTTLYALTQCQNRRCGQDMWIGPRQKAEYDSRRGRKRLALCYPCAILLAIALDVGDHDVRDLGGGEGREGIPRTGPLMPQ